jgi:hypothetical protein
MFSADLAVGLYSDLSDKFHTFTIRLFELVDPDRLVDQALIQLRHELVCFNPSQIFFTDLTISALFLFENRFKLFSLPSNNLFVLLQ